MDLARSIQEVTEEIVLRMARHAAATTGERNACLAGGVALNCVANGRLLREGPFERHLDPAGGRRRRRGVGAALYGLAPDRRPAASRRRRRRRDERRLPRARVLRRGDRRATALDAGYPFERVPEDAALGRPDRRARRRRQGRRPVRRPDGVRPRALGHRSILGDAALARDAVDHEPEDQVPGVVPPVRPAVLAERASDYFDIDVESPYMMLVASVRERLRTSERPAAADDLRAWVNEVRSEIPAVTHVDYSARLQTVDREQAPSSTPSSAPSRSSRAARC